MLLEALRLFSTAPTSLMNRSFAAAGSADGDGGTSIRWTRSFASAQTRLAAPVVPV